MIMVWDDAKVRNDCHITENIKGSTHRDCNINVKLSHQIHIVFHNLKNYGPHLIMQERGKVNFKIRGLIQINQKNIWALT